MAAAIKEGVNSILDKISAATSSSTPPAPREPTDDELKELKTKYEKANQSQVFAFWDDLTSSEKGTLFAQVSSLSSPDRINELADKAINPPKASEEEKNPKMEPLPESLTASILDSKTEDLDRWYAQGLDLVAANEVAVVLMAGGQGTRLGSSAPKGCFDIGLPSEKSLFQIQAERIGKIQKLAAKKSGQGDGSVVVPWYVMTSGPTRKPTEEFFEKNKYFGLEKENVIIFEQGVLPCISNEGKILLESKSKVSHPNAVQ